jgi:hypothetical protein
MFIIYLADPDFIRSIRIEFHSSPFPSNEQFSLMLSAQRLDPIRRLLLQKAKAAFMAWVDLTACRALQQKKKVKRRRIEKGKNGEMKTCIKVTHWLAACTIL